MCPLPLDKWSWRCAINRLALAQAPKSRAKIRHKTAPAILGIGTATPPAVGQEHAADLAAGLICRTPEQRTWLSRIYQRSGIDSRGSVLAGDNGAGRESLSMFYAAPATESDHGPGTAARMEHYAVAAPALAHDAASRALAAARIGADAITHLITVSCTGFFAPGLDAALIQSLGLQGDVRRLHVGFMGCHAAFNALGAARDAVRANKGAAVLVCCVELCSLHFAYGWDPGRLVANALFADGAAAAVVGRTNAPAGDAGTAWRLRDTASALLPDSLDAMTWRIGDHGFEMTLSREVPGVVRQHLEPWCRTWLARHGLRINDVASWAVHPGGVRILGAVASALGLPPAALRQSRQVLARHGNMSSATVLFVLQQMAMDLAPGPCVAIGLGPGIMAEGMLLDR